MHLATWFFFFGMAFTRNIFQTGKSPASAFGDGNSYFHCIRPLRLWLPFHFNSDSIIPLILLGLPHHLFYALSNFCTLILDVYFV